MKADRRICQIDTQQQNDNPMIFSLKSLDQTGKRKVYVKLDFTGLGKPAGQDSNGKKEIQEANNPSLLLPQFSYSNGLEMRAFFQSGQKASFKSENQTIFQRLMHKTSLEQQSNGQILTPKPISTYCQLCRQTFDDYLTHIEHTNHKKKLLQSSKNIKMIDDLISGFQYQAKRSRSEKIIHISDLDDEDSEISNESAKIRVIENQNTLTPMRLPASIKLNDNHIGTSTSLSPKLQNQPYISNPSILLK